MNSDFNWKFYLYANPDLKKDNIITRHQAEKHFFTYGRFENRKYKIEKKINDFDNNIYYLSSKIKCRNSGGIHQSYHKISFIFN